MPRRSFSILLQHIVPQRLLTKFAGCVANCRWPWLKNFIIRSFIKKYGVDLQLAILEKPEDYPNFNLFFTRSLKPSVRPCLASALEIACPADACVSQAGEIIGDTLFQAKGFDFNLINLLGNDVNLARKLSSGHFATFYLAPKDYHRVHMPIAGKLMQTTFIPGHLFSVNQNTASNVQNLFARNERLVCVFETAIGPMAVILVGAMLVSSISTVWTNAVIHAKKITTQNYAGDIYLAQGAELGHFQMGSTVIVLFPKDTIRWQHDLLANKEVQVGQKIGNIIALANT
jgi:phosphatidylserine decarboxylase